jgi:hypothetical protein
MTTQTHKRLPSEPTQEMIEKGRLASISLSPSRDRFFNDIYEAMWQAAPLYTHQQPKRELLSCHEISDMFNECTRLGDDGECIFNLKCFARAVEKDLWEKLRDLLSKHTV